MSIALEYDFALITHADLFRHANGCQIGWIDHGDQSPDPQRVEREVAYGARRLGGVSLAPGRTSQAITDLHLRLSIHIREEEQTTISDHFIATLLNDSIGTKTPIPIIMFEAGLQP